jgi:perosamine synthetase
MPKISAKSIYLLIKKTIGKGPHHLHEPLFSKKEIMYTNDTIKKNYVSSVGIYGEKFEKKIKKFTKAKYVVAVINGTQGLYISMQALGIKKDQEVLVPALTFVGTVNAISYTGAEPHFIDSNIKDFGIDCGKLEIYLKKISKIKNNKCINKKTGRVISGIVPVHIFGHSCDIENIIKLAKKFKLKIIEDAAEALGSFYKKKHLGTLGDIGCFSFNGNKIITTGGGGAVITNKKNLAKKIKHLVNTAKVKHKWDYIHDDIGFNFKMPSLNAALGLAQMAKIDIFVKAKRRLFNKYTKNFRKLKGVKIFKEGKNLKSNYWLQTLILDKKYKFLRNELLNYCYKKGIYLRPTWRLISSLKPYKKKQKMDLRGARDIAERVINLPSSQSLIINKL